jgi:hypothetical protein
VNPEEALFCMRCGKKLITKADLAAPLLDENDEEGNLLTKDIAISFDDEVEPAPPPPAVTIFETKVSMYLMDARHVLPIMGKNEFTLGRKIPGSDKIPDVDLSPYKAFSLGVSRIHATIRVSGGNVLITDNNSSNGTFVNNKKIPAFKPIPVKHKDIVTLGLFRIQFLVRAGGE